MTYYYFIPIVFLFFLAIFNGNRTGSPLASQQVNDICAHMTKQERIAINIRCGAYGFLLGTIPAAIGFGIGQLFFKSALNGVIVAALLLPLIALVLSPYIHRVEKSFFASTEWAKSQGIEADDIKLFRWNQKKNLF